MYYYEILPGKVFLKYRCLKIVEFWGVKPSSSVDRYTLVGSFRYTYQYTALLSRRHYLNIPPPPPVTISNLITQYLLTQIYSVQEQHGCHVNSVFISPRDENK